MKKLLFLSMMSVIMLLGCQSDEDAYNVEGFTAVKEYVDVIIPQIDGLTLSAENEVSITEDIQMIEETNESLYVFGEGTSYDKEEMSEWKVELGLEEGEWEIEGAALYDALNEVKKTTDILVSSYIEDEEVTDELMDDIIIARGVLGEMMRK